LKRGDEIVQTYQNLSFVTSAVSPTPHENRHEGNSATQPILQRHGFTILSSPPLCRYLSLNIIA